MLKSYLFFIWSSNLAEKAYLFSDNPGQGPWLSNIFSKWYILDTYPIYKAQKINIQLLLPRFSEYKRTDSLFALNSGS